MWKESYLTGIEQIDLQHKQLFSYAGQLLTVAKEKEGQSDFKQQIVDAVKFLKLYCLEHFKDEEVYHAQLGIDEDGKHKSMHTKLATDVVAYEKELADTNFDPKVVKKFLGFLITWLVYHVAGEDQKLKTASQKEEHEVATINLMQNLAARAKRAICVLTGLRKSEVDVEMNYTGHITEGIGYNAELIGSNDKKGVGLIFSNSAAKGALLEMTSLDSDEMNDVAYAALSEIANILSVRIADAISEDGSFCDAKFPLQVNIQDLPKGEDSFTLRTKFGDIGVIIY